jgi:hypothetical protein
VMKVGKRNDVVMMWHKIDKNQRFRNFDVVM